MGNKHTNMSNIKGRTTAAVLIAVVFLFSAAFFTGNHNAFARSLNSINLRDGQWINTDSFTLEMDYSAGYYPMKFILDGKDISSEVQYADGKASLKMEGLEKGSHRLFVGFTKDFNPYSLISDSKVINFEVDLDPPPVEIVSPPGELVKDRDINLEGRSKPGTSLKISIGEHEFQSIADDQGFFNQKIPVDGEVNILRILATDRAGNVTMLEKRLVLDSYPPVIVINSPLPGQTIDTVETVLSVTITDTGSGLKDYYFIIDGKKYRGSYNPAKKTYSATLKNMDEGLYEVGAEAFDHAGWKTKKTWNFTVNSTEELGAGNRIRPGAVGEDIVSLQNYLQKLGYLDKGHSTGVYDSPSIEAVRNLQMKRGLPITGIVDKQTKLALYNKIFIYLNEFALYLVSPEDEVVKKYDIACGSPYYPTPLGNFKIIEKVYHPSWYPPNSPWARGLKPSPPGPGNPLGTRWIGLDGGAIGIHGTPQSWSIGSAASHGCIRMYISSVEELFEMVDIGTPVTIFDNRPEEHKKYKADDSETAENKY